MFITNYVVMFALIKIEFTASTNSFGRVDNSGPGYVFFYQLKLGSMFWKNIFISSTEPGITPN